jgi:hypothetical protein
MLYKTPPEELEKAPPPARQPVHGVLPVLAVILFLGLFAVGCAYLMIRLIHDDRNLYCISSGRRNCAPIPD